MRPVNLIPPEQKRGAASAMRTGPAPFILLGLLALMLVGVVVLAVTGKQISDQRGEKENLEAELQEVTARADALRAFTDFRTVQEQREATVSSLAQSRFDWERVMRELARVIPSDVWLSKLTGTVSPGIDLQGGADVQTRGTVTGPALEIVGCTVGQDEVAGFVAALEDIDGVTRVGLDSSEKSDDAAASAGATAGSATGSSEDCQTRDFIYQFEIVVAFDEVPVPATAQSAPGVPAAAATPPPTTAAPAQAAAATP